MNLGGGIDCYKAVFNFQYFQTQKDLFIYINNTLVTVTIITGNHYITQSYFGD
jgi:hypothetical protein